MKIVFWGSPDFAVYGLETLCQSPEHEVVSVVSQPDKKIGRRGKTQPPPVAQFAHDQNIPVLQPFKANNDDFISQLETLSPDIMVIAAYGKILSKRVLELAPHGCVNVHFSLLPKYRGASPITSSILEGDSETGVSIMRLVKKMDTGPVYRSQKISIGEEDTTGTLQERLGKLSGALLLDVLPLIEGGDISPIEQDHEKASYCYTLEKKEGKIPWDKPASYLARFIRAMHPWPTAHSRLHRNRFPKKDEYVIIHEAKEAPLEESMANSACLPGTVLEVTKEDILVQTGKGGLKVWTIQKAGKSPLSVSEFLRGTPIEVGDNFYHE